MNPLHQFALALVVLIVAGSLFLVIVRQVAGRRWAAILEAIRGLLFWSIAWILFTIWAYFLQATTLAKLTRPEMVGWGEPWLSFFASGCPFDNTVCNGVYTDGFRSSRGVFGRHSP